MNYSIMYVMTQTRKAFVNGVIHSKPSQSFVSQCLGKADEHLRPKLPRCVTVLLAPAVPYRRLFWYLSVETAVVLFSSAN